MKNENELARVFIDEFKKDLIEFDGVYECSDSESNKDIYTCDELGGLVINEGDFINFKVQAFRIDDVYEGDSNEAPSVETLDETINVELIEFYNDSEELDLMLVSSEIKDLIIGLIESNIEIKNP